MKNKQVITLIKKDGYYRDDLDERNIAHKIVKNIILSKKELFEECKDFNEAVDRIVELSLDN